jgi:rifampicin phosphotransferase
MSDAGITTSDGEARPAAPPEFDVEWTAEDAARTWEWEELHNPAALTPLAGDYQTAIARGFNPAFARFGSPMRIKSQIIAGYWYLSVDLGVAEDHVGDMLQRLHQAARDFAPDLPRYWRDEALPEILAIADRIRAVGIDQLSGPALAAAWDARWQDLDRVWEIHFIALRPAKRIAEDLSDRYAQIVPDAEAGEAVALVQGRNDILQTVEEGIEKLVDVVANDRAVADRLRRKPAPSIDEIRDIASGRDVAQELESFLDAHGHMGQPFEDLTLPSWSQDPSVLLVELAKRLDNPPERSTDRRRRLRIESERRIHRARALLAGKPDELSAFDRLVDATREVSPLTETHNYWIDRRIQAEMRALALRVGTWLARAGSIADPADVFYLTRTEVADLLRQPADRTDLVGQRRIDHEHWRTLKPPATLGRAEDATDPDQPGGEPVLGELELRGVGASRGTARGPARVVLGPADFERIHRGDIIVCPTSNPSWVPVFAIAGGLVANTGGLLAHAAVVAREFGLPAVVGVRDATSRIADGRWVEIDGTTGVVRLL